MSGSFMTKLKQIWVPKQFRLPEPEFTKDQVDLLEELLQLMAPTVSMMESSSKDERANMAQFLVDLGTGIWRVRKKIESLGRLPEEIRAALYALESTWKSMSESGVEIVDHDGTIPSESEAIIVEVRDIPNLVREQVVETRKPTILHRGEVIQLGEVVLGRPARAAEPAPVATMSPAEPQSDPEPEVEEFDPFAGEVQSASVQVPYESVEADELKGRDAFVSVTEAILGRPLEEYAAEQEQREQEAERQQVSEDVEEAEAEQGSEPEPDDDAPAEEAPAPEIEIEEAEEETQEAEEPEPEPEEAEPEAEEPEPDADAPAEEAPEIETEEAEEETLEAEELDGEPEVAVLQEIEEIGGSETAAESHEEPAAEEEPAEESPDEGFVRDVPTPYDAALAAEEAAPPKRKRASSKRGLAKSARLGKSGLDDEPEEEARPKRRSRKLSSDLDEITEDLLNG